MFAGWKVNEIWLLFVSWPIPHCCAENFLHQRCIRSTQAQSRQILTSLLATADHSRGVFKSKIAQPKPLLIELKDEGLKVIDFDCLNGTLKINWIKSWIKHSNSFWYCIPNHLFNKIGGLKFLLITDFNIDKLPVSLSEFHKQILLYWKMLYVHNFSPHTTIL